MLVGAQRVAGDERAGDRLHQRQLLGIGDPEHAEPLMPEIQHLVGLAPGQHVGEMADAEAHLGAEGGGEQFPRDDARVERGRRAQAIVAIAAGRGRILAEMPEQDRAAAGRGLDQGRQRVQPLPLAGAAALFHLGLDPPPRAGEILGAPEQPGLGRLAVAARPAGLLVEGLDRLGDAGMGDEADVRLVDAHAEGDGRDHHHLLARHENALVARAQAGFEPGMIGQSRPPGRGELGGDRLRLVAARHIDDARPGLLGEQGLELGRHPVARTDMVADVRPVEAGDDQAVRGDAELREDVGLRARVGGGGEREPRHLRKGVEQRPEQPVVRPEVVPPFADAMRLVDRDQRRAACARRAGGSSPPSPAPARHRAGRARPLFSRSSVSPRLASTEVKAAALIPNASAARIWSCIRAMSGEMTSAVPSRASAGTW